MTSIPRSSRWLLGISRSVKIVVRKNFTVAIMYRVGPHPHKPNFDLETLFM